MWASNRPAHSGFPLSRLSKEQLQPLRTWCGDEIIPPLLEPQHFRTFLPVEFHPNPIEVGQRPSSLVHHPVMGVGVQHHGGLRQPALERKGACAQIVQVGIALALRP